MTLHSRPFSRTAVLLALALLAGCQAMSYDETRSNPPDPVRRYRPSAVFTSPSVLSLLPPQADEQVAGLPWYAARNDARLTTYAAAPAYESSATWTVDRQYSVGSHVRDYYYRTTWRYRVNPTSR